MHYELKHMASTGLDYANGKIPTLFRKIFFPTLLGMIFNALITIVDGIFVGNGVPPHVHDEQCRGAVSPAHHKL
ncbi:MAG: hypothetical protein K2N48_14520 [Muribaculaceae bacterium]|nr:hypothetical protein [Muribaculaceae bacterium]